MANVIYNSFKKKIADGNIDLDTDTIKVLLVTSAYVPDQDLHDFKDDVTNEITGTGYTAGGQALANKTVTQDNTNNKAVFDADDVVWASSSLTARGAVIYKDTGTAGTSPLIAYIDFSADKTSSNGNFTIQWNASGILSLS
ncbi:MAG: hypothetical protein HY805_00350 [Nitrospirae bacterium]|nr:hypothetical protein [Nitrospirota bacterium]